MKGKKTKLMGFAANEYPSTMIPLTKEETTEELLQKAIDALEDYLNAGSKESRRNASVKAKMVYEDYYKKPYQNKSKLNAFYGVMNDSTWISEFSKQIKE